MTRYKRPHVHSQWASARGHPHTYTRANTHAEHIHTQHTHAAHTPSHTQTHILILSASLITLGGLFNEAGNSTHLPISTTLLLLNRLCLLACWLASHLFIFVFVRKLHGRMFVNKVNIHVFCVHTNEWFARRAGFYNE